MKNCKETSLKKNITIKQTDLYIIINICTGKTKAG